MKTANQLLAWIAALDDRTETQTMPLHLALGRALAADVAGLTAGTTLGAAQLGLLAEADADPVSTFTAAGVALVTIDDDLTGNEDPSRVDLHPARAALAGAVATIGQLPVDMGAIPPRGDLHVGAVHRGFEMAEIVCTIGADPAWAADMAAHLEGEVLVSGLDQNPGALTLVVGDDGWWFGLPADAAEALALFTLVVAPLARRIAGHENFAWPQTEALVDAEAPSQPTWCWARRAGAGVELLHAPGAMTLAAAAQAEGLVLLGDKPLLVVTR